VLEKISNLIDLPKPPKPKFENKCKKCAYYEYCFAIHVAEVEIDKETFEVKVKEAWCAHDSGRPINLQTFEGQIEGGFTQGMAHTVMENFVLDNGKALSDNFTTYLVPTFKDAAPVHVIPVLALSDYGPFGAKGVGEIALMPAAGAVANAISNAIGVQPKKLPVTPEYIYSLLKGEEK
jgi:CO/xanthine dehydrogenase Mo-binding subunit